MAAINSDDALENARAQVQTGQLAPNHSPHLFETGTDALEAPKQFFVVCYVQWLVEKYQAHHGALPLAKEVDETLSRMLA